MMNKNKIDIDGDFKSDGDVNIGNTIENQSNIIIIKNNGANELIENLKKDVAFMLAQQQLVSEDRAREKLEFFSEKLLPKLVKAEMIDAFKDPAIQIFFREEQKTALCSERDIDISILSEMLVYRIVNKENISKKASVSKAFEIIDKVSDDALIAITIHYLNKFYPVTGNIKEGLNILDNLYENILEGNNLPTDNEWIDNTEILGLTRVSSLTSLKRFEDILFEKLEGYCVTGIQKESEKYNAIIKKMNETNIPIRILVDHEFNPNYVRLNVVNLEQMNDLAILNFKIIDSKKNIIEQKLSPKQLEILKDIYNETVKDKSMNQKIKEQLILEIEKNYSLNIVMKWWNNNLKPAVSLNSVGNVVAHTNAKRLKDDIPDMV